ncbi:DHH family phosphoesterase, partial [Eubacteriales bacterium OttesenSCG-928-K08]|nr:DHH family phosphoesterase [Eubacteriales bacterium OttesenSCG-928-K08]
AIATVADIVPLVAENRAIIALGLPHLHKYPGVLALLNVSGSGSETDVSGDTVAFRLAPRINAAGRMGDAKRALQLLTTNDSGEAFKLAAELNEENALRQSIEQKIFNEAQHMLRNVDTAKLGAIVLCSPDWNPGVIGIVASKLVELHYKPVLLFHQEGDLLVGSCRSTSNVHLYETLETFSKYFIRFGGHAQAAGITMERAQFEIFAEEYNSYIQNTIPPEAFDRISLYDAEVELSDLTLSAVEELRLLAPYGLANPQPVLRTRKVCLRDIRRMGSRQNHLRAIASKGTKSCQLVAFGQGEKHEEWENAAHVDMLYTAALNEWMGNTRLQLQHVAINIEPAFMDKNRTDELRRKFYDAFFDSFLYNDSQQNSVQASTKEECRLALSGSRFGTLVLCLTLEGAREFWKDAQTQGICSSISICYGKTPEGSSSQNTLLLAPQNGGLDFSKYERVFVYDCPYVELLRFSGEVYVCEDATSVLLEPLRLNREEMGKLFLAAKAALGGRALEKGSLLANFDMKCYDSVSLAILVFIELELMEWNKIERSIVLIESASRRDLFQSMLYRLANVK